MTALAAEVKHPSAAEAVLFFGCPARLKACSTLIDIFFPRFRAVLE
jgi:hypothetical protein